VATPPVYTRRFFGQPAITAVQFAYVPSGKRWIMRDIDVYANNPLGAYSKIWVIDRLTGGTLWWHGWNTGEQSTGQFRGRQVLTYSGGAGGLIVQVDTLEGVDCYISGYEFDDPSDV